MTAQEQGRIAGSELDPSGFVYTENGERVLSARDRLKVLRSQYASALARYNAEHPDAKRYKREIEGLEAQLGSSAEDFNETARRLTAARGELAAARKRYSEEHPDVLRLQREVSGLEESLSAAADKPAERGTREEGADNPAFIQLRAQRNASANERDSLQAQAQQVRTRISEIEQRQGSAPEVEREYNALLRDLQNEQAKYEEVRQKQMEAQLVQNLETERKGERFTLIEPPLQPSAPVSPNRKLLIVLGFIMAAGAAVALVFLLEQVDTRIRDRTHLLQLVGVPALAVVPYIDLAEDATKRARFRMKLMAAAVVAIAAVLLLTHLYVLPLDALGRGLMRRLGL